MTTEKNQQKTGEKNAGEREKQSENETKKLLQKLKPGMTVRIHQQITEGKKDKEKKRIQVFEGIILAYKKGRKPSPTILVRKISGGIGVEKIFPVLSPLIKKIVPVKQAKVRKSKLYYLRNYKKRLKEEKV